MCTIACWIDFPAMTNCLLSSLLTMEGMILVRVKLYMSLAMLQVSEIGLIPFSMASGGDCLGIGVTAGDFKRGGK